MTPVNVAWAGVVGVALGMTYAASPLTVWFVIAAAALIVWAGWGLSGRERRWLRGVLGLAIAIRVLAIVLLFLTNDYHELGSFSWDGDGAYLKYRALVIWNVWAGNPVAPSDWEVATMPYYGWSSYIKVLAYLQYLTGPSPYGVHLFNVVLYLAAAVLLYRLVRPAFGRASALLGLTLMLLLPTLVAWSASALKESLCVLLFAAGLRALVEVVRGVRWYQRFWGLVVLAGVIAAGESVRVATSVIIFAGLSAGILAYLASRRGAIAIVAAACVPLGVAGLWQHPRIQEPVMAQLRVAASIHRGNFLTTGTSYQLLDARLYSKENVTGTMTPDEGLRFVVRAALSFILVPLPWQLADGLGAVLLPQQLVWYGLVALSLIGMVAGLRRDVLLTCLLVGLSLVGAAAIALNNGNVGTLVRFRDWIVPFVVWLSALGAVSLVSRVMGRVARSTGGIHLRERDVTN